MTEEESAIRFKNVFINHPDGRYVLREILKGLGVFESSMGIEYQVSRNIGIEILRRCGIDEESILNKLLEEK